MILQCVRNDFFVKKFSRLGTSAIRALLLKIGHKTKTSFFKGTNFLPIKLSIHLIQHPKPYQYLTKIIAWEIIYYGNLIDSLIWKAKTNSNAIS